MCHVLSSFTSLSACYCLASSILVNHDAHHYTVPSSLLLRLYSSVQTFSSSVYSLSPPPIFFQCVPQSFTPVQKLETKYAIQKTAGLLQYVYLSPVDISCNV